MILAQKIVKLRKQEGWSQEELANKMDVSRQSVSKWESANSIPDLNKIITLAQIFEVSTDYLLKDDIEASEPAKEHKPSGLTQISLEQANDYVESKMAKVNITVKGVLLAVCSVIPMFFLLAMVQQGRINIGEDLAGALGIIGILVMVGLAVSFFIRAGQFDDHFEQIEEGKFELAYGVHSVFQQKLKTFRPTYNIKLTISIFLFMFCFVPLLLVAIMFRESGLELLMLIVLMLMIATGLFIIIPVSAKFDAYNRILEDHSVETLKSKRIKRAQKLGAFYWPLITAIYLGWSLWTMQWGVTWIIWPVASVLFAALVGLMELLEKDE